MIGNGANAKSCKQWNTLRDFHTKDLGLYSDDDTPSIDKKAAPRRTRRNSRRKRNRGSILIRNQNTENMADPPELSDHPRSETPENDKQKMRKRNVLGNRPIAEVCSNQNKSVKFYSPLLIYQQLQMEPADLYQRFQSYVMKPEQLLENGFPLFSVDNPGVVTFNKNYKFNRKSEDPQNRWCWRCGSKFIVSEDGLYEADNICTYHSGSRRGAGPYSCCGNSAPKGCMQSKHHVTPTTVLQNVKYMKTRDKRQAPAQNKIYALDCEMCYTLRGFEVTRISVVGTDGLTVYDSYVLPESPVVDYNTEYSGITANHLKNVTTTLPDVQAFLLKFLNSKTILVGHGLENDLKALHLIHETVVDTSVVFPHQYGPPYKKSLKSLTERFLKQAIRQNGYTHDSVEDARACIELMLCKVQSDNESFMQSQQKLSVPANIAPIRPYWSAKSHTVAIPYSAGYWVPPVGSSCDLY